jgi:hypothetical protein
MSTGVFLFIPTRTASPRNSGRKIRIMKRLSLALIALSISSMVFSLGDLEQIWA